MAQLTIQETFDEAVRHHRAGHPQEAEQLYKQVLDREPNHAGALHYLGVIANQVGRPDIAVDLIRRAIAADPDDAEAHASLGNALRNNRQPGEAIAAYRQAIALLPNYAEACCNLGAALSSCGRMGEAIAAYRQAIALRPDFAEAHYNLGTALSDGGQTREAIPHYQQAIALRPSFAEARRNLGNAWLREGQFDEAIAALRQAIALNPDFAEAYCSLGIALKEKGRFDEAVDACRRAIALRPNLPEAHSGFGHALAGKGQLDGAIAAYRQAIVLKPHSPGTWFNLGKALKETGQIDDAVAAYRQAITLKPDYPEAIISLGNAIKINGDLDEAMLLYRRAIALRPDFAEAFTDWANGLKDQGDLDNAIAAYRRAIELAPTDATAHSNLIYAMHYHPDYDAKAIAQELRRWNEQFAEPLRRLIPSHSNDRDSQRRLRIGYVSPDFRDHPVGRILLSLFAEHDHRLFEITGYSHVLCPDAITRQFQQNSDHWRNIVGVSDEQAAEQIRDDRIDILLDLALHTAGNRLLVFARKPAPILVTYLGYPGSTGLSAIDYRLSDPFIDPPGTDGDYTEKTIRLPRTYLCWRWNGQDVPVRPPPARTNGFVTFGCLNNFCKVTPEVLRTWGKLMSALPNSRLILRCPSGCASQRVLAVLAEQRIDPARVDLIGRLPWDQFVDLYHRMDIGLDPFPYCGHATTLEALWMGIPVVTLSGKTAVGRGGRSILSNLDLPELIAVATDDYLQIAINLANDMDRLATLRQGMRARMLASPLMDAKAFAHELESAYRQMWRAFCDPEQAPIHLHNS